MMNIFSGGFPSGIWILHILFNLLFVIGFVLFLVWLVQYLNKKQQLITWAIILLTISIVGILLTFQGSMFNMMGFNTPFGFQGMYQHMFDEDHEEITSPDEFRQHMIEEMEEHMGI